MSIIFGIDPGFGRLGYAILESRLGRETLHVAKCIETSPSLPHAKRLRIIYDALEREINAHRPNVVAIEKLFFAKNQKTALGVAEARGIVLLLAEKSHVPIFECTPLELKIALTGYGKAQKSQVQAMVKTLLRLPAVPKPDDIADAIAVALTCAASWHAPVNAKRK